VHLLLPQEHIHVHVVPFNLCKGHVKVLLRQNLQTTQDVYKTVIRPLEKLKGTIFFLCDLLLSMGCI